MAILRRRDDADRKRQGAVAAGTPDQGTFWWLGGKGTVSQSYGNPSSRYQTGYHDGMDIAVPVGTGVAALTDGEVVFAGDAGADGYRVGIRMDNGKTYYYGHLSSVGVKVGDRVGRGQVVAKSGDTGRSTGPHVHFELNRDGDSSGESPQAFLERHTGGTVSSGYTPTGGERGNGAATEAGGGVNTKIDWDTLEETYGYPASFFKSDPSLRQLVEDAIDAQWTPEEFQARFRNTEWFKTTSAAEREWKALKHTDRAEAKRRVEDRVEELRQTLRLMGVPIPEKRLRALAQDSLRLGLTPDQQQDAIAAEFKYKPDQTYGGLAGETLGDLRQRAADYVVPISDATLGQWTTNVLRGEADPESFDEYLKAQAKSLFPELAPQIDRGMTVADYLDPYREIASRELGVTPDEIDWFDPKWSQAVFQTDDKGERRVMGLADWGRTLRTDKRFGWDKTDGAMDQAAQFVTEFERMMGRRG